MPRKTKRTMRRYPPLAKELIAAANELDRLSRRIHLLAEKVSNAEHDSEALQRFLTTLPAHEEE